MNGAADEPAAPGASSAPVSGAGKRSRTDRLLLAAFPRTFRAGFGDELVRSIHDLRRHGHRSSGAVAWVVVSDVAPAAFRLRLESLMTNHRAAVLAGSVAVLGIALLVGSPVLLVGLAAIVVAAVVVATRGDRPISDQALSAHWYRWVIAAAVSFGIGFAAVAVDGDDELSSFSWWTLMGSWCLAIVFAAFGLILGSTRLLSRRTRA